MSGQEAADDFAHQAIKVPGCVSVVGDIPDAPSPSYGWSELDFCLIVEDETIRDKERFDTFLDRAFSLNSHMVEKWYPTYWHPFTWITQTGLNCLGPLETANIQKASPLHGEAPTLRAGLEPPIYYYSTRLRNYSCQIRRWLYAYGPEGMVGGNWGKYIAWTKQIAMTGLALLKPETLHTDDLEASLEKAIGQEQVQETCSVLGIDESKISTRKARQTLFHTLLESVDSQRSIAQEAASSLVMKNHTTVKTRRDPVKEDQRTGYRPELAKVEDRLLSQISALPRSRVLSSYVCRGEPSSLIVMTQETDTTQAIKQVSETYPMGVDIFLWMVFEEEVPLLTHESPAEFAPGCFGPIQPKQIIHGKDLLKTTTIPLGQSALSCLNAFMPMVRRYSFFTKKTRGECEPQGLDHWIQSYYTRARLLKHLCDNAAEKKDRLITIVKEVEDTTPRPQSIEQGLHELETDLLGLTCRS